MQGRVMASPQMKEHPSGVVLNTISKAASPESKCPICLDHFKNISYLDVCLHKFCFCCIHEWSKNKAECPLCKQPFNSIYHTIKSEDNYKRFDLRPTENGSFGNMAGQRFRYRTTLTGERRPAPRRTSPPPDHGVIFEGLRGSLPQRHSRDLHSMIRRLAVRQRRESEGRSVQNLHEQEVIKFRRALYRRGVRVQSVQDGGRTRETSAEFFKRNPACLHRLVPWLRRELTVLYGTHGSLVNIVQHIIMTLITRQNLDDQAVLHELRPFLLSHTEHFLHEFLSFAQSPFNMEAYDQRAVYDVPRPSRQSSSSETSVIDISEDESDSLVSGAQDYATPTVTLSQTAWDDETPGPSYSSELSQGLPFHVRDSDSDSSVGEAVVSVAAVPHQDRPGNTATIAAEEEGSSGSDEDCVIISYVKPVAERTPELVQLSSDSEHSEQNEEPQNLPAPQHIRFTSESDLSPTVPQRPSRRPTRSSRSPDDTSTHLRKEDKYDKRNLERELSGSSEGSSHSNRAHSSSCTRKHPVSKESKHYRNQGKDTSRHTSSYWHSYSHYSQQSSDRSCYTETCSSYTSYYRRVYNRPHSLSHSRRRSMDREDRIKSGSSSGQKRRHSRSNSQINSSNRRHRSHYDSRSRIDSSNRQERSVSRSNSRINSSNRQERSRSRSNSRTNSSNRLERSRSRSNSRTNSSNRQERSRSRSNSRTNSSKRQERSRSRSNSRINSNSSHQTSLHDEYGKKRKYKTKHYEEPSRKSPSNFFTDSAEDGAKKKNKKHHKRCKRKSKSPSIDDKSEGHSRKHHKKKKKKHKKKSKRHNSESRVGKHSPLLITINSDSDNADSSEPSTSNICGASSTFTTANSSTKTETQPLKSSFLDMEQQTTAGTDHSSVGDAGNQPMTD
ncbi:topoisomerase I binding, arginine/serine-rich a [Pimephales promelas]|uniref:topoisomerase I binding, arginine/serine-rich a n=1 Tax=Pimephales promelas TaxID=90988 RepID=UPI0019558EC1|nr:topoisomerase I binding, arginine/serine-rich a [Pimephales promelas]XP_039550200.1 topoisomerase I binding, arginine/serine-rich a [Pimephales promelas]XP_039550207.1 topoisomerase I binding, arginine/serine-rich a [Pimephales promelas]KAG1956867.1 E3 ubiquitin-protein ligase Topors [Pimephales promelas]